MIANHNFLILFYLPINFTNEYLLFHSLSEENFFLNLLHQASF